jgi:hypothetical protein
MLAAVLYFFGYEWVAELATLIGFLFLVLTIALFMNKKKIQSSQRVSST